MQCFQSRHGSKRPLPRLWLMTDERVPELHLLSAIKRLPRESGVVLRHYGLADKERRHLFDQVQAIAVRRRLVVILAGAAGQAKAWGADGFHGRIPRGSTRARLLHSAPVHDLREIRCAERLGANLLFLSPVFPTRSHPDARPLGRLRFGILARSTKLPLIALGGMDAARARILRPRGAYGWAAVDALTSVGND